jgi:hypothetical protein
MCPSCKTRRVDGLKHSFTRALSAGRKHLRLTSARAAELILISPSEVWSDDSEALAIENLGDTCFPSPLAAASVVVDDDTAEAVRRHGSEESYKFLPVHGAKEWHEEGAPAQHVP